MKVLCLLDSVVKPGDRWLWSYLPSNNDEVDFLWITAGSDRFPKWGKLLTYYPTYFWLGVKAATQIARKDYDVVVAWEGKNGFPLALIRRVLGMRKPKMVILAYNQRGVVAHFPALTRFALESVDRLVVLSKWEAAHLSTILGIPAEKVTFCLLGWYDVGTALANVKPAEKDFIFACGRSYRDYATFAAAVAGLECQVVINARQFNLKGITFPPNVVINDLLPVQQFWTLLAQARFVVVPLKEIPYSGGDSVILQAMAAGKAVVATQDPSPETYVEEGVTGLLVPPYDVAKLREAVKYLLDHPEEAERMGRNARKRYEEQYTFSALAQRVHCILEDVCRET